MSNLTRLMESYEKLVKRVDISLTKVWTEDTASATWTGIGTKASPLKVTATGGGATTNASLLTSGTLADARLTSNVPLKDAATNTFAGAIVATTITGTSITGTGRISALLTTEQLRLSYDVGNFTAWTVSSAGNLTVAPSGGTFSITGALTATGRISNLLITEQMRLQYDASNYMNVVVASAGSTTFDLTGTAPTFTFGKGISVTGTITGSSSLALTGGIITNPTNTSANFAVVSGNGVATTTDVDVIFGGASQIKARIWKAGGSGTLATNDSFGADIHGQQPVTTAASGTHAWLASYVVKTPTLTSGGATVTNTTNIYVEGHMSLGTNKYSIFSVGKSGYDSTVTAGGTTGAQTINKPTGTVNFAAAAATLVVTNSMVSTSSIVYAVIRTADATATGIKSVVPASGSFTITLNANTTAETSVGFIVFN